MSAPSVVACRRSSSARNEPAADPRIRANGRGVAARRNSLTLPVAALEQKQASLMFLSDVSIKRPVFATMMMVALVVLGIVSYRRLAIDEYPDVTYPTISVQTSYPGASPEVIMRQVSKPLEENLNTVQGIKEINSSSSQGRSNVRVTFNL